MEGDSPPRQMCLSKRILLFCIGLTECCIFGGMVFGWPQLVLVLKQEGIYADLCATNDVLHNSSEVPSNSSVHSNRSQIPEKIVDVSASEPYELGIPPCGGLGCYSSKDNLTTLSSLLARGEGNLTTGEALDQQERNLTTGESLDQQERSLTTGEALDQQERSLTTGEALDQQERNLTTGEALDQQERNLTTGEALDQQERNLTTGEALDQQERWRLWKESKCEGLISSELETANGTSSQHDKKEYSAPCDAQDARFALFFTIAVVSYSLPSVVVGYLLHYAGLWVTRIIGSSMITASFVCLGLVSPERPHLLLPALVLLAMGGNQLRLCAVQLGDLFPTRRATAITLLMGSYSASSSVFFLFQVTADMGVLRPSVCWGLAAIGAASLLATFAMPVKHVSEPTPSKQNDRGGAEAVIPLGASLWSASSFLHQYWLIAALFALNSYQQTFNYWVTASSCTSSEIRTYTGFFSFCGLAGVFVAPVFGYVTDFIAGRAKRRATDAITFRVEEVSANFIPLFITSACSIAMYSCLLVFKGSSIYVSLVCLLVCRSCIFSASTAFLRARFPVQHLDRLLGIYGSVASVFLLLQYPHFVWAMSYYYFATCTALVVIGLNLTYPLHLLYKKGIRNTLQQMPQPPGTKAESWLLITPTK